MVDAADGEPAGLAGSLDGEVAGAGQALPNRLAHAHVLHFGQRDGARGFGKEARLPTQLVAGDDHLAHLPAQGPFDGPEKEQGRHRRRPFRDDALRGEIESHADHQQYQDEPSLDEL